MEQMESEQTWARLIKFLETEKKPRAEIEETMDPTEKSLKEKYFGLSSDLKERLYYRLNGPRFPRDMDAALVREKNN